MPPSPPLSKNRRCPFSNFYWGKGGSVHRLKDKGNTNTKTPMLCKKFFSHLDLMIEMFLKKWKKYYFPDFSCSDVCVYMDSMLLKWNSIIGNFGSWRINWADLEILETNMGYLEVLCMCATYFHLGDLDFFLSISHVWWVLKTDPWLVLGICIHSTYHWLMRLVSFL